MTETYIETARYRRAVTKIADLKPCPFTGKIDEDLIKTILGEVGGVWPNSIHADCDLAPIGGCNGSHPLTAR